MGGVSQVKTKSVLSAILVFSLTVSFCSPVYALEVGGISIDADELTTFWDYIMQGAHDIFVGLRADDEICAVRSKGTSAALPHEFEIETNSVDGCRKRKPRPLRAGSE